MGDSGKLLEDRVFELSTVNGSTSLFFDLSIDQQNNMLPVQESNGEMTDISLVSRVGAELMAKQDWTDTLSPEALL